MLGIIGGTGLYQMDALQDVEEVSVETPFGNPSAAIITGQVGDQQVAFIPRHGQHHTITPSEVNYRANIWALKSLGVTHVISVSAVGSLREELKPGDLCIPSQYIDWTRAQRQRSFFGQGVVGHISSANPTCPSLVSDIAQAAQDLDIPLHQDRTYICVEGPRLGTRAESHCLRTMGADIVGMTNVPEVFLAREAQMGYATIAIITDYDCWKEDPSEFATVEAILKAYQASLGTVKKLLEKVMSQPVSDSPDWVRKSLEFAIMTRDEFIPEQQKEILEVLKR